MSAVKTYRDLDVWQSGMTLVEETYGATRRFPADERFGLTAQLRRAAVSVSSNIAEGACRRTTGAFVNHVSIALGSHAEVETCFEVAMRLEYVRRTDLDKLMSVLDRTGQLLHGLLRSLEAKPPR
jgi:four helix bundle protein